MHQLSINILYVIADHLFFVQCCALDWLKSAKKNIDESGLCILLLILQIIRKFHNFTFMTNIFTITVLFYDFQ